MTIVIGHRGACAYRPEHTLASYELAARMGADYLEPDLVMTRDGVLVARHEPEISGTTDVAARAEFADRRATKPLGGREVDGWFAEDFTLAELKTLRARERLPELRPASAAYDGRFDIPTFQEIVDLAARHGKGVYPETKHPARSRALGLPLEPALAGALRGAGVPAFVQSFDPASLRTMRELLDAPRVQLLGSGESFNPAAVAAYADAVGPVKTRVDAAFMAAAHGAGLQVHPWTFRAENTFLPEDLRSGDDPAAHGDLATELRRYLALGVDGVFTDFPDVAAAL
ncbi:MAG: glycerophosphoryl diester phosphodiesterase [Solirubrobacteraceae bacterium]|nr:glycerophosphoryl diester phosphodiesterase [Solirubrobacteraceae bacterium]